MNGSPPDNHRQWPAWAVSVVVHSLMVTTALVVVHRQPRGASDEPSRAAGIVLRRVDDAQTHYEDEESVKQEADAQDSSTQASQQQAAKNALPDASQANLSRFLPSKKPPLRIEQLGVGPKAAAEGSGSGGGGGGWRSNKSVGGAATVSVFGVQGTGHKFVYAFDRSVSMTGAPLSAAKSQLLESLKSLDKVHRFQILFFNHRVTTFDLTSGQNRVAFANDKTRRAAAQFVGAIFADGGTDRYAALSRALGMGPDVVFFLTDADDAMTASELQRIGRLNNRVGASICAIEFGRGPDPGKQNFLHQLARESGGSYGYVDTTRLLRE